MKTCFKCGEEKELDGFYRHPMMKDGHLNKCKECNKVDSSMRDPEKLREYERKRSSRPERKEYAIRRQRENRRKYPEKNRARRILLYHKRKGSVIQQPCEVCGNPKTQAHHDDYSRPLEVRWLCMICHKRHHITHKEPF